MTSLTHYHESRRVLPAAIKPRQRGAPSLGHCSALRDRSAILDWRDDWHINRRRGGLNRLNQYSDLTRSTPRHPRARLQPRRALRAEQGWGGRVAAVINIVRVASRACQEFCLNFPQNARFYVAIIEKLPGVVKKKNKSEKPLKEILPRREKVTQIFFPVQERTS